MDSPELLMMAALRDDMVSFSSLLFSPFSSFYLSHAQTSLVPCLPPPFTYPKNYLFYSPVLSHCLRRVDMFIGFPCESITYDTYSDTYTYVYMYTHYGNQSTASHSLSLFLHPWTPDSTNRTYRLILPPLIRVTQPHASNTHASSAVSRSQVHRLLLQLQAGPVAHQHAGDPRSWASSGRKAQRSVTYWVVAGDINELNG